MAEIQHLDAHAVLKSGEGHARYWCLQLYPCLEDGLLFDPHLDLCYLCQHL